MKWLKDYFDLSKKEEAGFIALIGIIVFLFVLQYFMVYFVPATKTDFSDLKRAAEQLQNGNIDSSKPELSADQYAVKGLHPFDPNTMNEEGFLKLGLPKNITDHIIHYREKGGKFFYAEDLQKIYGLSDSDYDRLAPYIVIKSETKKELVAQVDLNTADSIQLMTVKGIGTVFAKRILYMRDRLGCFVNLNQLLDIYGIDSEKYAFIRPQVFISKQTITYLNINTSTADQLKKNPYLRYKLANAIVQYRIVNGLFGRVDDLKKVLAIDEVTFQKIRPYITI